MCQHHLVKTVSTFLSNSKVLAFLWEAVSWCYRKLFTVFFFFFCQSHLCSLHSLNHSSISYIEGYGREYVVILSPDSSVAQKPISLACICLAMSYWHILKSRFATTPWLVLWALFGAAAINHQLLQLPTLYCLVFPASAGNTILQGCLGGCTPILSYA